ncbi:MAG: hypothetical protein NT062_37885 [Proteobacteria bacterium]|nr:hypothetical protein [Pseudomonadota bacterium]
MPGDNDAWYESEEPNRHGLRIELQRVLRRARNRPLRILVIAALLTGGVFYKLVTKPQMYDGAVVLVVSEASLASKGRRSLPVDNLREYVLSVLLPAKDLLGLIERHHMYPLRKQLGNDFALGELWQQVDIKIWKNSFIEFAEGEENDLGSARIGITVTDRDPELAFELAREIASIIIASAAQNRVKVAGEVKAEVDAIRNALGMRQAQITTLLKAKLEANARARDAGKVGEAAGLAMEVASLVAERKKNNNELTIALSTEDAIADRVTAAGLDMSIDVVDEQRPDVSSHQRGFVMILILVVIGMAMLMVVAFLLSAFDSRIHDTDDVERLGLPVLGHVPGFQGDHVGSLEARGARRSRVPSFLRWRSHR